MLTPFLLSVAHADSKKVNDPGLSAPLKPAQTLGGVLIAQGPTAPQQPNTPAAVPPTPQIGVPIGPEDKGPNPEPATPPQTPDDNTPVPPITTPLPNPDTTPAQPSIIGNVTDAEGREITDVRVVGNRVVPAETVLAQVRTQRGAAFSSRQTEVDNGRISQLGFFASVQAQVAPDVNDPQKVVVTYIVVENRVITGFRFEGNSLLKPEDLNADLASKVGTILNQKTLNQDADKIQSIYKDKGFAALVRDARIDPDGIVVFNIAEARISDIKVTGLTKTSPSLINKLILSKKGDFFDANKLTKDANRIYDTGFFEDVPFPDVKDDPDNPGLVIVTFQVKERRTGQFSVGVGFDSRSKISGFFTVSENNLRGTGKRAVASIETGSRRNYELSFGDPFVGKKNSSYDISVYNRTIYREPRLLEQLTGGAVGDSTTYTYEEERTGGRINFTQPIDYERTSTYLLGYRNESAKLRRRNTNGDLEPIPTADGTPLDSSGRVSAFSVGFLHDQRDSRLDASKGGREAITVEKGLSFLGGNTSFTKFDLDVRRYIPLVKGEQATSPAKVVLAGRLVVGRSLNQLPAFEQYYIGGPDTVRGYDTDEQFGDNQIYANGELRYRFNKSITGVLFTDTGSAYGGRFSSSSGADFLFTYGVGVRLQTPIGPVRLDLGKGDRGFKTNFAIGPTF